MINFSVDVENEYTDWQLDTDKIADNARIIFEYYLSCAEIFYNCVLKDLEFETISFDILFCDGEKTYKINREYRNKDYPADIITFAVFADSPEDEQFVLDGEINLGEIIIALDKITQEAQNKGISKESEVLFMISHGIMHLLGFDHQTESDFNFVVNCQKKALESIGIKYDKI